MPVFIRIIPACYQDSIILMQAAQKAKGLPGVSEAGFFMGTPSNKAILAQSGLGGDEAGSAGPGDIILSVHADGGEAAETAFAEAEAFLLKGGKQTAADNGAPRVPLKSVDAAKTALPELSLAVISVPGAHARHEAVRALQNGLHVFLFSDNVPLEEEIALKREAAARDLLCMGPDCGTAWLSGIGIGFANAVPKGEIGLISASGTGMQAVACYLAEGGQGISQGIGVGGRDMHAAVGGSMTFRCLELLDADPQTKVIVLISKPPAPELLPVLEQKLAATKTPCVVCMLGAPAPTRNSGHVWVATLADAADEALRLCGACPRSAAVTPRAVSSGRTGLLGLYTGGTLAYEARFLVEPLLGSVAFDDPEAARNGQDCLIDLGDDAFTVGRPHPMIAPELRAEWLAELGADTRFGVLLFDLVLGRASHPDPAGALVPALRKARQANPGLAAVASVVGTRGDAQNLARQTQTLLDAGVFLAPTNADAARLAARMALGGGANR